MKYLLASTALAVAASFAPAFAQEADKPTTSASPPTATAEGNVIIEGVEPSKVLGAIDTSKLVDNPTPPLEQSADQTARTEPAVKPATPPEAIIAASPEANPALKTVASVDVPLPTEVAAVVEKGKYKTADLVQAQLLAMNNAPPINTNIGPSSIPLATETPVFDRATPPGDWSQSAETPKAESSDAPAETPAQPG